MAAATLRLTERGARDADAPTTGQRIFWDADLKGFGLRVTHGGARAFILDYRANGRQRRLTIGSFPDWSVAAARERAKELRRAVDLGEDPMADRHARREASTMAEL